MTGLGSNLRLKSTTSLSEVLTDDNLPDGRELVSNLFGQMMFNWGVGGCPATSSLENWRHQKHTGFQDVKRSPEVPLERTIAALMDEKWANQIPVAASGLLGGGKTLDLACLHGDSIDLIELKVNSNTPLSAAVQVLFYGLAHVFFQLHRERVLPTDFGFRSVELQKRSTFGCWHLPRSTNDLYQSDLLGSTNLSLA